MRILVISHKPPYPPVDGGCLATLNMCIGLADAGNEVFVLTLSTPKHPSSIERIPNDIQRKINFEIHSIPLITNVFGYITNFFFTRIPYTIQRYKKNSFKWIIRRTLRYSHFDVVQLEGLYLYPYIKGIRKNYTGKIAFRAHNVEHQIWQTLASEEKNRFKAAYFGVLTRRLARIEKKVHKKVDALVAISQPDLEWFTDNGFSKPSICVPVGYFFKNRLKDNAYKASDKPVICYIGALDWRPNTDGLIWFIDWVWPRIQSMIPDIEFHIAGKNASETLAERLMIERNIIFHGQVADSSEFIQEYPIMVVPLFSGSGIRVKIIEGMFLQRAIVATSMAVKGIEVVNNEHILIADTPESFAETVYNLVKAPHEGKRIAENAKNFAYQNFDATVLASKLTNFYKSLLSNDL
ncbi:MAG: glycosyltransferase [Bacteroidales bacterium]|nr:glycosyltransferase [Bacteroidales bacterium]HPD96209.1 glycosyltransferase family 4 protein [Tenuifilaceae bacterium]HRX31802.1 glycosyltransferase family 4 protein [Tenuifilaceae bacterium]